MNVFLRKGYEDAYPERAEDQYQHAADLRR
jgi:hypothetical protein